jgi:cellulose biosynthesis protein BcsQ
LAKLNLIIADLDEKYIRGLSDYISANHSTAFLVSCFTKPDPLVRHLKQQSHTDVLLISPDFYDIVIGYPSIKLKVILSTGILSREYPDFQVLCKYNTGEKLLGEVVHLYSKLNPSESRLSSYSKNAEIIGVYSTVGGAGKTTIASALSMECTELGMTSFYLNLESIQSTGVFFNINGKRNLSYIFYYLKEKRKNLSFLMDGIKSTDADNSVQYFSPPESPLEYEELDSDEMEQLIRGIKEMGCYDFVFIDMSNTFDKKNLKIMEVCDRIILVTLQGPIAMHKNRILHNELVKLSDTDRDSISDKFITVINRNTNNDYESFECPTDAAPPFLRIPEYSRAIINEGGTMIIDDEGFRKAISQLMEEISDKRG